MKTDDLIRALSVDTLRQRPVGLTLALGLLPALGLALVGLWASLGFRPDLAESFATPVVAARYVLTGVLGLVGLWLVLLLAQPTGRERARLWPVFLVAGMALALLLWAYVTTPPDARQMALTGKTMVKCLIMIPLLSILPVAAIMTALRSGATTAPGLAGCLAGVAGGGLGAMIYALHCTESSPLFYVTWYGIAIIGVTLVSALIGKRILRW
jgi:hypothetical protein